jgi:hypothetical protein
MSLSIRTDELNLDAVRQRDRGDLAAAFGVERASFMTRWPSAATRVVKVLSAAYERSVLAPDCDEPTSVTGLSLARFRPHHAESAPAT